MGRFWTLNKIIRNRSMNPQSYNIIPKNSVQQHITSRFSIPKSTNSVEMSSNIPNNGGNNSFGYNDIILVINSFIMSF